MTDQQDQKNNEDISLKELVQKIQEWFLYLKTKWKLIFAISVSGAIIGFTYASFQKPTYQAITTFVLEEDKGGSAGALGLASSLGFDLGGGGGGGLFTSLNIMELMKSRLVIEKTLMNPIQIDGIEMSLVEYYFKINKSKLNWSKNPAFTNISFPANADRAKFSLVQDSILNTISSRLTKSLTIAQKDKKISIITLTFKSENELFSKLFCEQLLKETSDFYIETKSKKAKLNVELLQKQTDSVRSELYKSINSVAKVNDNTYNLNPAFNIKKTPGTKLQIDVQANTSMLTQLVAQLELAKVSLRKETPLIQIIDRPILPLEKEKLGRIKSFLLGGFLASFLTIFYLVLGRLYKNLVA
jgi:uncharacterized protein involved in exopolysaccharide biosynthesis